MEEKPKKSHDNLDQDMKDLPQQIKGQKDVQKNLRKQLMQALLSLDKLEEKEVIALEDLQKNRFLFEQLMRKLSPEKIIIRRRGAEELPKMEKTLLELYQKSCCLVETEADCFSLVKTLHEKIDNNPTFFQNELFCLIMTLGILNEISTTLSGFYNADEKMETFRSGNYYVRKYGRNLREQIALDLEKFL